MARRMLDGPIFNTMVKAGALSLKEHVQEINDLNVFPIPDGDTGDNMLMTMLGGTSAEEEESISRTARNIADGMLLSARGNSGVILSQFFDGIAEGFNGVEEASTEQMKDAFRKGVQHAYGAVMEPTEGTILTVARDSAEYAAVKEAEEPSEYVRNFIEEARRSLTRTPDLLPVLKKAGVVDSGGAGLIYIIEGMLDALTGDRVAEGPLSYGSAPQQALDLSRFNEDSVLEFGYCTELLLRLQNRKTDPETFDVSVIRDYLNTIGNSIVIFKTGSIVKLHVHTMTPQHVLDFCQRYGEFLTVKIENMSLQHNNLYGDEAEAETAGDGEAAPEVLERRPFGIVACVSGDGLKEAFKALGADVIVDGGQSMNPSSEAFIEAFDRCNADTVFVLPNNGNVILAARQAAALYSGSDVRVIESRTIGEGYAALSMYAPESGNADEVAEGLCFAMEGVITASVSKCVRSTDFGGLSLKEGDYIGFVGKEILAADADREETARHMIDAIDFDGREIAILVFGRESCEEEAEALQHYLAAKQPGAEIYVINGGQEIYDYILIVE